MKNKCTVIQINGFRGILIAGFIIMCAIAGFIIFPAWCCQHAWNFVADFVQGMPVMQLRHGALLWLIIALISYVTLFGKFKVAFIPREEDIVNMQKNMDNIELLQNIKKDIVEKIEKEEIKK